MIAARTKTRGVRKRYVRVSLQGVWLLLRLHGYAVLLPQVSCQE